MRPFEGSHESLLYQRKVRQHLSASTKSTIFTSQDDNQVRNPYNLIMITDLQFVENGKSSKTAT